MIKYLLKNLTFKFTSFWRQFAQLTSTRSSNTVIGSINIFLDGFPIFIPNKMVGLDDGVIIPERREDDCCHERTSSYIRRIYTDPSTNIHRHPPLPLLDPFRPVAPPPSFPTPAHVTSCWGHISRKYARSHGFTRALYCFHSSEATFGCPCLLVRVWYYQGVVAWLTPLRDLMLIQNCIEI